MAFLPKRPAPQRSAGFTVIELAISLAVTVIVLLAVLQLFDFSSRISRIQTNVSDMQQTQRIVHYEVTKMVRMTGRGGLPTGDLPTGRSVAQRDNVAAGTTIGDSGTPQVVAGSDVLTIRGNFSTPVYVVDSLTTVAPAFAYNPATSSGTLRVDSTIRGFDQALDSLIEAIDQRRPEALLLVSARNPDVYAVVELDPATSSKNLTPAPPAVPNVVLGLRFNGGTHTNEYRSFSSAGPGVFPDMTTVSRVSIVEEYRYYLREEREIPGDNTSELIRRLTRARTYPGTNVAYAGSPANWSQDIADNVLDLQVALGVNTTEGTCLLENGGNTNCTMTETADGSNDDWLYNDTRPVVAATWANADLYYVRINTLVRTGKRDPTYAAPLLAKIENRDYTALPANTAANERKFRRRVLQTVIDLRNL